MEGGGGMGELGGGLGGDREGGERRRERMVFEGKRMR